jgi:hypothetical protein
MRIPAPNTIFYPARVCAFLVLALSACQPQSDLADVAQAPSPQQTATAPAPGSGAVGEVVVPSCPNDVECLAVRNGARVDGRMVANGLTVRSEGLFANTQFALCGESSCDASMWWLFDEAHDRLVLRSASGATTNARPALVISRSMSEETPARIGIGVSSAHDITHELEVNGAILANEVIVETGWADHVFEPDYPLMPLAELADFIDQNGRLPGVPSAGEVGRDGVELGRMQASLLEKIEELTLHLIAQEQELARLREQVAVLEGGRE